MSRWYTSWLHTQFCDNRVKNSGMQFHLIGVIKPVPPLALDHSRLKLTPKKKREGLNAQSLNSAFTWNWNACKQQGLFVPSQWVPLKSQTFSKVALCFLGSCVFLTLHVLAREVSNQPWDECVYQPPKDYLDILISVGGRQEVKNGWRVGW